MTTSDFVPYPSRPHWTNRTFHSKCWLDDADCLQKDVDHLSKRNRRRSPSRRCQPCKSNTHTKEITSTEKDPTTATDNMTDYRTLSSGSKIPTILSLVAIISGAIHPSVPAVPDLLENDTRPLLNFLHRPKSEIIALTGPTFGREMRTFCGLISRWTMSKE